MQDKNEILISKLSQESDRNYRIAEDYWATQLGGEYPVLNFPKYNTRKLNETYRKATVSSIFTRNVTKRLKSYSDKQEINLFAILIAAVNVILYKYTRQCDMITGVWSDVMFKSPVEEEFVNTLPIRTILDKENSINEFLKRQSLVLEEAYQHRKYHFEELFEKLIDKAESHSYDVPEVLVMLKNDSESFISFNNQEQLELSPVNEKHGICFSFTGGDELKLSIEYNADNYDHKIMGRMLDHYQQILTNFLIDDAVLIKDIGYLTATEIQELLAFNNLETNNSNQKTVIELFEEQAAQWPDNIAVVFEKNTLTYKELDEMSDRLANYLTSEGIQKNSRVLLCFNSSMEKSIIGILGIMKAGGAYVPIDSDLPQERINYLVKDTEARFVVTNDLDAEIFQKENILIINLDETTANWYDHSAEKSCDRVGIEELAYVIYTSGTTGDPKGVMITHHNLTDYFYGINNRIGIADCKSNGLMSTIATDLGNTVLFGSLIYGNTLHLFSKDTLRDAEYIHRYFKNNKIDCIKIVPTYWKALEYNGNFIIPYKMIIFGGEQLLAETINRIRSVNTDVHIINHYGPTETTIGKLLYKVGSYIDDYIIPIGRPFSNTSVYVVDEELSLCAKGIWGELLIGGNGVFKGYLNNTYLTEQKRIQTNFQFSDKWFYRTGDLVRINSNGEIEFSSRVDNQVKIQGYRIEPGGIEAIIMKYPEVKQCFISVIENGNADKLLVAYLEGREGYIEGDLKTHLKLSLPAYMIPSIFVKVSGLPMTSNGKIDKKKLPVIDFSKLSSGYEAPVNEVQHIIIEILQEMFNREQISINDNFYELGGDSIKSIQVASRLRQRGYQLQLKDIVKTPVVKEFSARVKVNTAFKVKEDMFAGSIPLSPIQKYFFENKKGNYNHYNQSVILYAEEVQETYIKASFGELIKFHDTLRIKYKYDDVNLWKQYYDEPNEIYSFECVTYSDEENFYKKIEMMGKSLDIQQGPLFRLCLFKGETQDILFIVIHHLLIDGVSFRILIEDLSNLYRKNVLNSDFELGQKSNSLKDWQIKLLDYSNKKALKEEELAYWKIIDKSEFDKLNPLNEVVSNTIYDRDKFLLTLDEISTANLLTKCYKKYNTEIVEILITALYLSLQDIFNVKQILINLEGHGREDIGYEVDVSGTLGWFTTLFPVNINLNAAEGYINKLLTVKEYLNKIPVKGIGYGVLKYLKAEDLNAEPEITFNYLGDFSLGLRNNASIGNIFNGVKFNYQDASTLTTCSDKLNFTCIIEDKKLSVYINFNKFLFSHQEIHALGAAYREHLLEIIDRIAIS